MVSPDSPASSIRHIAPHTHRGPSTPTLGSKGRRYCGDRGGGGRTSLHRPPDKSSSRIGLTSLCRFEDGVRRQRRWSRAWRQLEGRTCLQNRWGDESPPAGSIPVRLRYEIRAPTSTDARGGPHIGPEEAGSAGPEIPVTHTSLRGPHKPRNFGLSAYPSFPDRSGGTARTMWLGSLPGP